MKFTRREFVSVATVATVGCIALPQYDMVATEECYRKEGGGMLKGISPVISPDLLKTLAEMGTETKS